MAEDEDDDARHRREEQARRAKRKASKMSKSEAQLEKERKRKEHQQKILSKHGGGGGGGKSSSSSKQQQRPKPPAPSSSSKKKKQGGDSSSSSSAFTELFATRAAGFQMEFKFRNAPPRPPVGPTFVGHSIEMVLKDDLCRQYKPLNSVEVNYTWTLHSEADLGVPLAPSAMDLTSYTKKKDLEKIDSIKLHPADAALLNWTGSLGDTAADELKRKREQSRAAARLALASGGGGGGKSSLRLQQQHQQPPTNKPQLQQRTKKTVSTSHQSRVLKEAMPTFMKKTTYLSNDYSRKVHDFKSLAQSKQELAVDLQQKQEEIAKRRSSQAISKSFTASQNNANLKHPTSKNKAVKPKNVFFVVPNASHWGLPYVHLLIDKKPEMPTDAERAAVLNPTNLESQLNHAMIARVEKRQANARMTCQLFVPSKKNDDDDDDEKLDKYQASHSYDLDVVPLRSSTAAAEEENDEQAPPIHYCLFLNHKTKQASYLPIHSRVQLSTGRPVRRGARAILGQVTRRELTTAEREELETSMAPVNADLADKYDLEFGRKKQRRKVDGAPAAATAAPAAKQDDGEDDFGDDDDSSGDEELFGGGGGGGANNNKKTIVAAQD